MPNSNQTMAVCANCQAKDLRRLHRTFWQKAIYERVYKCLSCGLNSRVARLDKPSAWLASKACYVYNVCLRYARLWLWPTPNRNLRPNSWPSRGIDLLREVILELEMQLTRLRAKAQRGVHSGERR